MLSVHPDTAALTQAAADYVAERAAAAIAERGRFRLALSGGSTPRDLYRRLAADFRTRIDWPRVQVFFGDERCVASDHPDSNFRMASEHLLDWVEVGEVHRIRCERAPDEAAICYSESVGREPLDLVLLGMGYDGHTASLFPGAVFETGRRVVHTHSPVPPHDRVSLSLRTINDAHAVVFLVTGAGKGSRLATVRAQHANGSASLPAARVRPRSGELIWFVDRAAAGKSA